MPLPASPGQGSMVVRNRGIVVERRLSEREGDGAAAERAGLVAERAINICTVATAVMAEVRDGLAHGDALVCVLARTGRVGFSYLESSMMGLPQRLDEQRAGALARGAGGVVIGGTGCQ